MRRKEREITDINEILEIIDECKVLRIAVKDNEGLYIIPLNYGYTFEDNQLTFFIHSAKEGRKIDAFRISDEIAFEMDCGHMLVEAKTPCAYGFKFKSIIGNGKIVELKESEEKINSLSILMKHQTGKDFTFTDEMLKGLAMYKIVVTNFSGKVIK